MTEQELNSLLQQMSLEEKIAQLLQLTGSFFEGSEGQSQITGPMLSLGLTYETIKNTGSAIGLTGAELVMNTQEAYLRNNRLGIPLLFMADVIHGYKTIFPVPLAIGCSWDLEAAEESAEIAAREAAVSGVHVTFAPMVDLVRDARWGRVVESTGEDPYLNSQFARAFVRGFQGTDLTNDTNRVAACVKHFAGYGAAEGGREYNTVDMSQRAMREYYLPAYKAAIEEGCQMVMASFNTVDGIPSSGNRQLMRDLLRTEWAFDGVLISDWASVGELIAHGVAADEAEAAKKALVAGVDIEMMTTCYVKHLKALVDSGKVDEPLIDEAVLRILRLKEKLGLFENPYRGANPHREREVVFCEAHRAAARELALKSCVLLKNEGVLPLDTKQRIALIGPFAESNDILGPWSWLGARDDAVRLCDGMAAHVEANLITVSAGCGAESGTAEELNAAIESARDADVIVLALGEPSKMSGEAGSRADIRLPEAQLELVSQLKLLCKPMVIVLFNGRPLDLHGVYDEADAILEAWYPGSEGGAAIADLLYGTNSPSGKLTMSFPYSVGQVPVYYNAFNTGRPKDAPGAPEREVSRYLDIPNKPLLPFGFGLSYTTFSYNRLELPADEMSATEPLVIKAEVTNTGKCAGEEIVQLYIRDLAGEVVRPLKELKAFRKIVLGPGESQEVTFTLTEDMLRYHHSDLRFSSDAGEFAVFVGPNSRDVLSAQFTLTK